MSDGFQTISFKVVVYIVFYVEFDLMTLADQQCAPVIWQMFYFDIQFRITIIVVMDV